MEHTAPHEDNGYGVFLASRSLYVAACRSHLRKIEVSFITGIVLLFAGFSFVLVKSIFDTIPLHRLLAHAAIIGLMQLAGWLIFEMLQRREFARLIRYQNRVRHLELMEFMTANLPAASGDDLVKAAEAFGLARAPKSRSRRHRSASSSDGIVLKFPQLNRSST
jgi:cytochrome c biogenesis protein CcdA